MKEFLKEALPYILGFAIIMVPLTWCYSIYSDLSEIRKSSKRGEEYLRRISQSLDQLEGEEEG